MHAKKEGMVSVTSVMLMQPCQGDAVCFCATAKSTLFGPSESLTPIRNHWLRFVYNSTAQPKCLNLCNAFYGRQFCEPSRVQDLQETL